VREELGAVEEDISQLEELERLVKVRPTAPPQPAVTAPPPPPPVAAAPPPSPPVVAPAVSNSAAMPRVGSPPRPVAPPPAPAKVEQKPEPAKPAEKPTMIDELAFLKSVTEDEKRGIGSPGPTPSIRRVSGAQFQPAEPAATRPAPGPAPTNPAPTPAPVASPANEEAEPVRTLKCRECGTMNLPTEWYCESCGAELAAL